MVSWGYFIAGLTWITSISYSFAHWFPNIRSKSHGVFTIWMWIFFIISVGLFVWGSSFKSKTFHSYVDVTNGSEWLQRLTYILLYTRHSWQLSNKDSLACYNYCDSGNSFIMVITEDPWHTHIFPSVYKLSVGPSVRHYLNERFRSVATGDRTPSSRSFCWFDEEL